MIYNSLLYIILFPLLFLLVYAVQGSTIKKYLLLVISYTLYCYYNQQLVAILLLVTLISYGSAWIWDRKAKPGASKNLRKWMLSLSVIVTILPLLFYRHALVAPLGISFFTFQALSYLFDVYRGKYPAERNLANYALYVAFFPSVIAGPINRYDALKPQFLHLARPDYQAMAKGLKMILWGMFLKTVIADRLLLYVNPVLDNYQQHSGSELLTASVLYSIQLYTDFAGYSLLAIGSAAMLGIRLQQNFYNPYFATCITDFWHRWHISLSQWLRDYIYIPLGGSRCSKGRTYLNILITFLVSGIWHGANWTFQVWGALHGAFQAAEKALGIAKKTSPSQVRWKRRSIRLIQILITFGLINLFWIFFRMPSISDALAVIQRIFTEQDMHFWVFEKFIVIFIAMAFIKDLIDEIRPELNPFHYPKAWVRWASYLIVATSICLFGVFDAGQFIYARF